MDNRYQHYGCPPLMSDGRFLTNYTRGRVFDQSVRKLNNISSVQDYKQFIQTNAETIMTREREFLTKTNTCQVHGRKLNLDGSSAI